MASRVVTTHEVPKLDIPKPITYGRSRNAREIENFLWDLEQYFKAMKIEDEAMKVHNSIIYITDITILW